MRNFLLVLIALVISASEGRRFLNLKSRNCLDSIQDGHTSLVNCTGENSQNWEHHPTNKTIVNVATGKCLDTKDNKVVAIGCNILKNPLGDSHQEWRITKTLGVIHLETDQCLEDKNDGDVYLLKCSGSWYQKWQS